jgi:hypothetical protein
VGFPANMIMRVSTRNGEKTKKKGKEITIAPPKKLRELAYTTAFYYGFESRLLV